MKIYIKKQNTNQNLKNEKMNWRNGKKKNSSHKKVNHQKRLQLSN